MAARPTLRPICCGTVSSLSGAVVPPGITTAALSSEPSRAAGKAAPADQGAAPAGAVAEAVSAGVLARDGAELSPAVVIPGGTAAPLSDDTVPQQIGRTVGRAATKAADLLANLPTLPKFGRKK